MWGFPGSSLGGGKWSPASICSCAETWFSCGSCSFSILVLGVETVLGLRLWRLSVVVVWLVECFLCGCFGGAGENGFCSRHTLRVVLGSDNGACCDGAVALDHKSDQTSVSVFTVPFRLVLAGPWFWHRASQRSCVWVALVVGTALVFVFGLWSVGAIIQIPCGSWVLCPGPVLTLLDGAVWRGPSASREGKGLGCHSSPLVGSQTGWGCRLKD